MSWVPLISDEQASPEVKRIYDYIRERWSFVPNYFRALGHDAQLLQDQTNLYTNAMFDDRGLPRVVKEQLAIVVSGLNVSTYCLPAHLEILGKLGMDKAIGRKLALNYPSAPVEPKVMELFRFADKLTRSPGEIEKADVREPNTNLGAWRHHPNTGDQSTFRVIVIGRGVVLASSSICSSRRNHTSESRRWASSFFSEQLWLHSPEPR